MSLLDLPLFFERRAGFCRSRAAIDCTYVHEIHRAECIVKLCFTQIEVPIRLF